MNSSVNMNLNSLKAVSQTFFFGMPSCLACIACFATLHYVNARIATQAERAMQPFVDSLTQIASLTEQVMHAKDLQVMQVTTQFFFEAQFTGITFGEGFGINTNIFETNIINLSAVIAIVFSFVGQNLTSLLDDRRKTILNNLEEANQRALEAKEKLDQARNQLDLAKKKAVEIREEGILQASQELNNVVEQHQSRLDRLNEFQQETIQFYQQKSFKKAILYVISRSMTRVRERLTSGLDNTYHVAVNNFYVSRFTDYKL